jgi:hypothetical protein
MHARPDRGAVRLLTRTGLDWTHKYPAIAAAVALLPAREAYLDGELCGVRPDGITSFSLIQNASDTSNGDALVFLPGRDLGGGRRRRSLRAFVARRQTSVWYRDLAAGGPATLQFAGRRLAVLGARRVSAMVVPDRASPILCEG